MPSRVPFLDVPLSSALVPPIGFAQVHEGIYRSAYPVPSCMPFLEKLDIKTMICLCPADLRADLITYAEEYKINLQSFDVKVNQEPFLSMDDDQMTQALEMLSNPVHRPVLIFCVTGKVKTSCLVGCFRKQQSWSFASITEEFELFAEAEGGLCDLAYIHRFVRCLPSSSSDAIADAKDES